MHDFKNFPELTNSQMQIYYFDSPHRQITEDFEAEVVKVHDGDTITLRWKERNFDFPIRFINIAAPELKGPLSKTEQEGARESQKWLEERILNQKVDIVITNTNRVDKWGRLLGNVVFNGIDVGEESIFFGHSKPWEQRGEGLIPDFKDGIKL